MAITYNSWKKYSDQNLYDSMSDSDKKKWWDYGTSQGLVPTHRLGEKAKAEMNKYTSGKYKPELVEKVTGYNELGEPKFKPITDKFANKQVLTGASPKVSVTQPTQPNNDPMALMRQQTADYKAKQIPKVAISVADPLNIRPSLPSTIRTVPTPPTTPVEQPFSSKYATESGKSPLLEKFKSDQLNSFNASALKKQQEKEEKARIASAKSKLDAIQAEIKKLQKEQGLFGAKNASKIATLFNQSQALKLEADPKFTRFIQSGTSGAYGALADTRTDPQGVATSEALKTVGALPGYESSDVLGKVAQGVASYAGAGAVIKAVPAIANAASIFGKFGTNVISKLPGGASLVGKVGAEETAKFVGQQGVDFLIDRIVQEPQAVFKAIREDEGLDGYTKGLLERSALDMLFNLGIGIGGDKVSQAIKDRARRSLASEAGINQMRQAGVKPDDVLKALDGDVDAIKRVQEILIMPRQTGIDTPITRQLGQEPIPQLARQAEQATIDKTTTGAIEAFQNWRKQNFGGATGDVSPGDLKALQELYLESTGIDIRKVIESGAERQRMADVALGGEAKIATQTPRVSKMEITTPRPDQLAENRLRELGNRVRSGEVTQAEGEVIARRLVEEAQTARVEAQIKQTNTPIKTEVWYDGSKTYDPQTFKVVPSFYKDGEYIALNSYGRHTDAAKSFEKSDVFQKMVSDIKNQKLQSTELPIRTAETPDMSTLEGRLKAFAQENDVARMDTPKDESPTINVPRQAKQPKPLEPIPDIPTTKTEQELASDFRGKVSRDTKGTKEPFFTRFKKGSERARSQIIDDVASFERIEKDIKGYIPSAEESFYKTARTYKGATEKANLILEGKLANIVDRVIASGKSQSDLGDYALAVHAKDVNKAGLNSGFTNAEIDATIKELYTPEIESARQELVKLSNELIDDLVNSGRIEAKQAKAMRDKWANYMPLFRSFDDEKVDVGYGLAKAFSNVSDPIKSLKGSSKNVIDPLESMVKNIYRITDTAARNNVGVKFHEMAQLDKTGDFVRRLADDEVIGRKNVVGVFVDGKKINYEVDPDVFKAFNNLDAMSSGILIKILSKPANILRAGATLAPEFAASNPIRDIQSAFMFSKSGFTPLDFVAGISSVMKKDDLYKGFVNNLGAYGGIAAIDRQAYKKSLESALKQPVSKKFVNVVSPKSWIKLLQGISSVTEQATKVGEYKAALRSGATPQEAAYRARDLMDFARAGSSTRQINQVVAFFNGNIQGKSKLIRAIKEDPAGVMTRMAISTILPTIGISAYNDKFANEQQKATINDAQPWMRSTFWLIAVPGTDMVARIPKAFDVAVLSNVTERFLDYAKSKDPDAFDGLAKETLKNASIPTMLTGITPIIEGATNYSFFRQGNVIPQAEEGRRKVDQYDSKTSEVAKGLANAVSSVAPNSNFASPRILDYVARSSTGGLGSYALDATDFFIRKFKKDEPTRPSKSFEQLPVIKRFMVNPLTAGKSTNQVYDFKQKLSEEKESAKFKFDSKYGKPEEGKKRSAQFDLEYFTKEKQNLLNKATDATDAMSDFSKLIKSIESNKFMSSNQKRDEIEKIVKERNEFARKSIAELKLLEGKK